MAASGAYRQKQTPSSQLLSLFSKCVYEVTEGSDRTPRQITSELVLDICDELINFAGRESKVVLKTGLIGETGRIDTQESSDSPPQGFSRGLLRWRRVRLTWGHDRPGNGRRKPFCFRHSSYCEPEHASATKQ